MLSCAQGSGNRSARCRVTLFPGKGARPARGTPSSLQRPPGKAPFLWGSSLPGATHPTLDLQRTLRQQSTMSPLVSRLRLMARHSFPSMVKILVRRRLLDCCGMQVVTMRSGVLHLDMRLSRHWAPTTSSCRFLLLPNRLCGTAVLCCGKTRLFSALRQAACRELLWTLPSITMSRCRARSGLASRQTPRIKSFTQGRN